MNEEEWRQSIPLILRIARWVANRVNASVTVRDELLAEGVTHLWRKIHLFDPTQATFRTWATAVLHNLCVSMIRKEATRRNLINKARTEAQIEQERQLREGPAPSGPEQEEARRPRFDIVETLDRLRHPIDRILLGAYAGVISSCRPDVVERWCREAGFEHAAALHGIEALPRARRKRALATLVGQTSDWVRQRIFRATQVLKDEGFGGACP